MWKQKRVSCGEEEGKCRFCTGCGAGPLMSDGYLACSETHSRTQDSVWCRFADDAPWLHPWTSTGEMTLLVAWSDPDPLAISTPPPPLQRSSAVTMSMEESTTRRGALGALLAGAIAIPGRNSPPRRVSRCLMFLHKDLLPYLSVPLLPFEEDGYQRHALA